MKRYGCYYTLPDRVVLLPMVPCRVKDVGISVNGFHRTNAPNQQELMELVHTISHRVAGFWSGKASLSEMKNRCSRYWLAR